MFRIFIAGTAGTVELRAAPGVEEAFDLLTAGGVHPDKAADLAVKAEKYGHDPVVFARKFLRAREAVL